MAEQQALLDKERLRTAEVESKDRELKLREKSFAEDLAEFREELEQLETAQKEFASNKKIIDPERADLDMEVEQVHAQLEEARFLHSQQVNKEKESLNGLQVELEAQRIILEQKEEGLRQLEAKEEEVQLGLAEINARREAFEFDRRKFDDELQQVEKGRAELDQGWADLDAEANRLHETLGEERSKIEQQLKGDREAIAQREIELSQQQKNSFPRRMKLIQLGRRWMLQPLNFMKSWSKPRKNTKHLLKRRCLLLRNDKVRWSSNYKSPYLKLKLSSKKLLLCNPLRRKLRRIPKLSA